MITKFFESLSTFSLSVEMGVVSLMLFGEYEYPKESDYE